MGRPGLMKTWSCPSVCGLMICVEISTLTYEKSVNRGRLILAKPNHVNIELSISF